MTRQEMADRLDRDDPDFDVIRAAAAELRKNCGGCKWFLLHPNNRWTSCAAKGGLSKPPADGTGFCHEWSAK
jgi:hypothetical protein